MPRPYILAEQTWATVKETAYKVAVLPWGATEAHNYHLPYGTDVYECDSIAAESARLAWDRGAKVVVLPTVPFGVNTGQLDIKLDLNMYPSTQLAVLSDIAESIALAGIEKLVVLNGHGGNDFRQIIREIQSDYDELFICTTNWWQVLDLSGHFDEPGDHAGEMETSVVMHLHPDLVSPLSEAGSGSARAFSVTALLDGWVWAERKWSKVTEDTGVGDPSRSTAAKGERFFTELTETIAGFLVELSECPLDELYV
ncbi:MAG: creatininase family protein [Rhodothermia bacterium]